MHKAEKKWNPVDNKQLEDLDFADDLALLSNSHQQMQENTSELAAISSRVGLNIHKYKTKILKVNAVSMEPVKLEENEIDEGDPFACMGSIIDKHGGTDADVKAMIGMARGAFIQLKNIWSSKVLSLHTKICLFNSNVKYVLLYGAETLRTTNTLMRCAFPLDINHVDLNANIYLTDYLQVLLELTVIRLKIIDPEPAGLDSKKTCLQDTLYICFSDIIYDTVSTHHGQTCILTLQQLLIDQSSAEINSIKCSIKQNNNMQFL